MLRSMRPGQRGTPRRARQGQVRQSMFLPGAARANPRQRSDEAAWLRARDAGLTANAAVHTANRRRARRLEAASRLAIEGESHGVCSRGEMAESSRRHPPCQVTLRQFVVTTLLCLYTDPISARNSFSGTTCDAIWASFGLRLVCVKRGSYVVVGHDRTIDR